MSRNIGTDYDIQRKNKQEKNICRGVLICVGVIILLCAILTALGGCSGQRTKLPDGTVIDTWCMFRDVSSIDSELYLAMEPNSVVYWISVGDHRSKTSAGKLKATHPTGIGIEIETE